MVPGGEPLECYKIDQTQAFDTLVMASQQSHREVREIADELTTTGELKLDRPRRDNAQPGAV